MSKVHWYVKCGRTIPIFELGSNLFHISVDTPIPDWDNYYAQSKQLSLIDIVSKMEKQRIGFHLVVYRQQLVFSMVNLVTLKQQ